MGNGLTVGRRLSAKRKRIRMLRNPILAELKRKQNSDYREKHKKQIHKHWRDNQRKKALKLGLVCIKPGCGKFLDLRCKRRLCRKHWQEVRKEVWAYLRKKRSIKMIHKTTQKE